MHEFGLLAALLWTAIRFIERDSPAVDEAPAPPPPPLKKQPRACPFCGGASRYLWKSGPGGGHRLTCAKCSDIYTVNLGGETRWAVTTSAGESELCYAYSQQDAQEFVEKALSRVSPNAKFQVLLGADETTPFLNEYWLALTKMLRTPQEGRNDIRH